jgi:DNA-binding PadR family transcriptional regulator
MSRPASGGDPGALSINEWAVLGALSTTATYGFAAASELAPDGPIGRVWTVRRALVYRGINHLIELGFVATVGTAASPVGPIQRLLEVTASGRTAFDSWLDLPVAHIRDYRSELMLKLLFLTSDRTRRARFLAAQRAVLAPIRDGLAAQVAATEGFDEVLARWRLATADAAQDFLAGLADAPRFIS